jgi:hypothetical protein
MNRNLYNHFFWFNEYTNLWYAIPRDHHIDFFSLNNKEHVISSKDINVLIELIGNPTILKQLQEN